MKRKSIIVALLALWLILPILAHAAPVGKFTSVEGNVDVTRLGKEAIPARMGDALTAGDVIRTKSKAKCEVAFIDGSILRLAESTRLRVGEFTQEKEQRNATLNLFRGKIQNVVKAVTGSATAQSKYEIHTPTAVAGVRGTNFFVYHQAGVSGAIFKEGTGYGYSLNRPQDVRTINPGQAMVVVSADLPPTIRAATPAEMDQHMKDTAPVEKAKEEGKKEEEKKSDEAVAKADEGQKEEEKTEKDEAKTEQKAEETPGETKQTEKTAEASATDTGQGSSGPTKIGGQPGGETAALTASTLGQASDFSGLGGGAGVNGADSFTGKVVTGEVGKTEAVKTSDIITNIVPQTQDAIPPEIKLSLTPRIAPNPVAAYALPSDARALFLSPGGSLEAVFLLLSPELSSFSYLQTDTNLDGTKTVGSWSPLSDPTKEFSFKLTNLTEGYHTFKITGTDASKNETAFEFTLSGLALERIAEEGAIFQLTAKGEEEDSIKTVQITDTAGNVLSPVSAPWVTEITASSRTNIIVFFTPNKPAAVSNDKAPAIGVSATEEGITYSYSLDGGAAADSADGVINLSDLSEGGHTLSVKGKNAAGEFSTEISYAWTTDYTAPVAAIGPAASPDLSGAKLTSVTAAFSANESSTYSYSIDGGTLTSTGSSLTLSGLAEGSHTLSYTATDPAGNAATNSLTFSLSRYSLAGNVADLSEGTTVGSVTAGEVVGVSNESWGGWNISMGGSVEGQPPASFTAAAGGRSTDTVTAGNDGGYWLESIEGNYDGASALSGESALMYLSSDRVGGGSGAFTGSYSAASNTWQATDSGVGAYSEIPLAFGGGLSGAFFYHDDDSGLISENDITGLMGGIADLWTDSAPFAVMMGEYSNPNDRTLWGINAAGASLSGAGYSGFIGGIALNDTLEGMYIAIYIKPDGTTGYLTSNDIAGELLPGIGMWVAEGSIASVPMGSTSVLPSQLAVLPSYPFDGGSYRYGENHAVVAGDIIGSYAPYVTNFSATSLNDQNWGIWLWSSGGAYSSVPPSNWKAVIGFAPGDNVYDPLLNYDFANAYGILNITGSSWSDNELTGALDLTSSKILTPTTLTTFLTGDLLGTYNTTDKTWQAISGGAWSEKPLTFMSEVYPDRYNVIKEYSGGYDYSGGGYYYYTYNSDNSYGYKYSQPTSSGYPNTTTYYYSDGTKRTDEYDASGISSSSSETWDPQGASLSTLVTTPTPPVDETAALAYQDEYLDSNWIGDLYGIMGGTQSLWYETDGTAINTTKTGIPATILGEYYHDTDYTAPGNNIWYTDDLYSSNYKDWTDTTYDGGAYQGFMGGIEMPSLSGSERTLGGGLIALYIDPAGNAGYLQGSLAGKAYPDIGMFEMDGLIDRTQMATASEVGISASDLTDSTYWGWLDVYGLAGQFKDGTTAAGSIMGDYDYGDTLSIANWTTNIAQNWGIYGLTLYGKHDAPTASWTAKLGGDGEFGAYNLYTHYDGQYNYSNGDSYRYNYYNDNSYGYKYYYGSDGSYTYTYYYSDGDTSTYDSSKDLYSSGTWDPSAFDLAGLAAPPEPPTDVTVSLDYSYDYGDGDDDWGYWLADINNGAAVDGKLTGEVTGKFITYTKLGTISGDLLGAYNSTDNTWEAVSLGTWSGEPLKFVSEMWADISHSAHYYYGRYNYSNGDSYRYRYYDDNSYGYKYYYSSDGSYTYTYYNSDGGTYTYNSSTGSSYGTWDPSAFDVAGLAAPPEPPAEEVTVSLDYSDDYPDMSYTGDMYGLMGGAQSLWSGSDIPVTILGEYWHGGGDSIWYGDEIYSYNYRNDTYTTYDGGAYYGLMGGIEIGNALEGGFVGLYIDPSGNAGYLRGSLTGTAYPDIGMFEMSGLMNREQVATDVGVAPEDLEKSVWGGWMDVYGLKGSFAEGGVINAWNDYGDTLSINNYTTNTPQNWGIYGFTLYGEYATPASTSWTAKLGGDGEFGAYNLYTYYYGQYNYSNGDSYRYNYYNDKSYGYKYYYDSDGSYTYTYYYSDGDTSTYDSSKDLYSSGTWDPSTFDLAGLAAPPEPPTDVTVNLDYSYDYGDGDDDWGYWLADINNGAAVDGKLTGEVTGKFITYTKLGTISGDLLGTYKNNNWEAVSLGAWSGTPLSFVSDISARLKATARYYEASYSYADGGYYSYNYYTDNHDGYVEYNRPGSHYYTNYYDDGTTYTYDYNTGTSTDGRWDTDPEATIASRVGTPIDSDNAALSYSDDYPVSYGDGWMDGLMGGVASLWTATQTSPASVTMMGEYSPYSKFPHVWAAEIYSRNYLQDTDTTYDGGAYRGYLGGTEIGGNLEGRLIALYIDPDGHRGYLTGSLTGTAYPEIEMFEMEGSAYPTEVDSLHTGIAPENLYDSIWESSYYYYYGNLAGKFDNGGTIKAGYSYGEGERYYGWNDMATMSIVNYEKNKSAPWGIYAQSMFGTYTNPGATWTAKAGGESPFGAYNVASYHYGNYSYAGGGYYDYNYYTDDRSGYVRYYRPDATNYYINYYSDGTYSGYDYMASASLSGTWDTTKTLGTLTGTPEDSANATFSYENNYGEGEDDYGYWLADISDGAWSGNKLTGKLGGKFITYTKLGTMAGEVLGVYSTTDNTWQAISGGAWSGTPLSFVSDISASLKATAYSDGWLEGLMGGTASLWTATDTSPASVTMVGRYNPYSNVPHVWATEISSYNYKDSSSTTYDGGAYRGYLGGTEIGGSMEGGLIALYIDPDGNAGYLKGSLAGTAYPEIEMFEMEGGFYPVQMETGTGISAAEFYNAVSVTNDIWGTVNDFTFNSIAMGTSGRDYNYYLKSAEIGSSNWGIWAAYIDGIYEGITPASDNWNWSMEYRDGDKVIVNETTGTQWSDNKIVGADAGYWAEISSASAVTGISVGETRGTFDPTASTLQAVSAGVWLETNKFLEMAGTNPAALQKLNIPAVQVGKTTLTQASGTVNNLSGVTMSDVTFFATSTGNAPRIWATNNVSGNYTAAPVIGTGVNLTGGGLSATFTPQAWNTTDNKWLSTVNGNGALSGGSYTGAVDFKGAAAGTINNNGTFGANPIVPGSIGTAAGVAK
ncbi:MAG: FecR family protein [Syntrophales bacterium]